MKIFIKAKPKSKKEKVEKISKTEYIVAVKEPPIKGRANEAIKKALAEHFNISPSRVTIAAGHTSKNKVIEIK